MLLRRQKNEVVSAIIIILLLFCAGTGFAGSQFKIETKFVSLVFDTRDDAEVFYGKINYPPRNSLAGLFGSSESGDINTRLSKKVDLLFQKAQAILDMKKGMRKVRVRVYPDEKQLHEAYEKIFHGKCNIRGWYLYEYNTVFLNVRDVHEGMLAHELGHAIIDHYLEVRPPRATAEILAKYVDEHLFDEVRVY